MNLNAAWQARRSGPSASELEQALLRSTILSLVTLYVLVRYAIRHEDVSGHGGIALTGLVGWWILSIGIVASIWMWPSVNLSRRMLGIFVDVGVVTFALFFMDASGALILWMYLFVIFGNGIRYGRRYLRASQVLALGGFLLVLLFSNFWSHHLLIGFGFMIALIFLPLYVGTLTERLVVDKEEADEAETKQSQIACSRTLAARRGNP